MHSLQFCSFKYSGLVALPWLLCVPAGACAGAAVYRCVDAHGRVAFQANACPAQMRQTAVEIREQPLIDPDAPAAMTSPSRIAMATASACGKWRGSTRYRLDIPMVRMARAAAPMLPGCDVRTRTTRILERKSGRLMKSAAGIREAGQVGESG